jgi:hypothetical protein
VLPWAEPLAAQPAADERDALVRLWSGTHDLTEELISGDVDSAPLAPLAARHRVQVNVRRVNLPSLGTHVLYIEEYPYDEPFEIRRRVLLKIEAEGQELRVRQYTRRAQRRGADDGFDASQLESLAGCDLWLAREGAHFSGGTRGKDCIEAGREGARYVEYQLVLGEGLYWYRQRRLLPGSDDLVDEIAGFPHVDLEEAQLFSCRVSLSSQEPGAPHTTLANLDLHDRGGRGHFRTPDGRDFELELHGRHWPLSQGRESLVLILTHGKADGATIASSWTSLDAARVGLDLGWLSVECTPVLTRTGEEEI